MARKTVDVDAIRIKTNDMLALSTCSPDVRQGMIAVLTEILHSTGNYRGFSYLEAHNVPDGELPGIIRANTELSADGPGPKENVYPDETRVQFH